LFLCDGLNEVDSNYLDAVCKELIGMMQKNQNRLVMTCRELDYREQPVFASLVGEEYTLEALITPLRTKQIEEFVNQYITEGYVNEQDERWNYTSDEVIGLIKETRLRYECTNPLMLFTLMKTINSIGVERGKQIDTRGRLLQEFVSQLIQRELEKPKWTKLAFTANELTLFLSQVACTARRMKYRNAVPLSGPRSSTGSSRRRRTYREMAVTLDGLLVDPTVVGVPIADEEVGPSLLPQPFKPLMLAKMLEFAENAALISISQDTLLSFRHELIAEYYVAEYLCEIDNLLHQTALPFGPELIKNVGDWNEPIRIWAGLLPDPMTLAKRLAGLGLDNSNYGYNALTLSMMCIGVRWAPPQGQTSPQYKLPRSVGELLTRFVMDEKKQEKLAATFNQCAQEGGEGVYRSLLPFIEYQGIDELLLQLDKRIVPGLVFEYLRDAIDRDAFENVIPHLIRVLGGFGDIVVEPAVELSKVSSDLHELSSDKHVRLRKAAIAVLGRTDEQSAVEPLMAYLGETEVIRNEAVYALIRLGPELALESVLKELASRRPTSPIESIHWATLAILEGFLGEQYALQPHSAMQHQTIIEALLPVLSSKYDQRIQQKAKSLLLREAQQTKHHWAKVVETLIQQLSSTDTPMVLHVKEMLRQIGHHATPFLLIYLKQPRSSETMRMHIVEVLGMVCDPRALPPLKSLIATPSSMIQEQVAKTLRNYGSVGIPILIDLILSPNESESAANRSAQILVEIGKECVIPVTEALPRVVLGRTQLLVQVLEQVRDPRAIPALIALLKMSQRDSSLAVVVIQALSQFPDKQVVAPLLDVLASSGSPLYENASKALSLFGEIALDDLIAGLDVEKETVMTRGVRDALLYMRPFPSERLLNTFTECSEAHAQQIMIVFRLKGEEVAPFLVNHLCHHNERIQRYVRQTLHQMEGQHIILPLLDTLNHPTCRPIIASYLRKYLQITIPLLVDLLGDSRLGDASTTTLVEFGPVVIPSLVAGLNDQRGNAQRHAQDIIVRLVHQQLEILPDMVREDRIQTEWKLPVVPRVLSISRQGLLVVASNSSELFLGRLDERFPSAKHPGYWLAAWSPKRLELATLDARDETTLLIWQE